jgi:hypothetical protein
VERSVTEALDVASIFLTLKENQEEEKLPGLRDELLALLGRDQGNKTRWECLKYHV